VTGTKIDVEPDGKVNIYGGPDAKIDLAIHWVKTLAGQIEIGSVFTGIIRRIAEFGLFVELVPGIDGLVHVSNIPKQFSRNFGAVYKNGDEVTVKVLDHDESTGRTSLRIISEQQPDQKSERKSEDNY
jgi:polyribonucleotide nucleotidyltransferase